MSTFEKTQQFLARRFTLDESEITPERTLQSLGIDSLATMERVGALEHECGITVPDGPQAIETLRDLVALIDRQLALQSAAAA